MASSLCFAPLISSNAIDRPGLSSLKSSSRKGNWIGVEVAYSSKTSAFEALKVNAATDDKPSIKVNSILCSDCEGNGAKVCSQCQGAGVNSEDHFNGQFKAGALCWLCRGKKEILCGNCNGAGFMGGFMSTQDE
ncbi:metal homeostatis protein bsd2 [Castilleja foliolosa]|uniref:Metal homeostatis protein bsd2 n=1 Tax=Castilleja foliolosa TaxID=1961234 RepID=A0ABD3CI50_9LAMI